MQAMPIRIFLILFILILIHPSALQAASEQRIALVIGNSAYSSGPLKNPVNDAADMAAMLRKLGFSVTLKKNAGLQEMDEAIEAFGNHLKRGDVGLFYYAGHGVQVNGANYLLPIGTKINKEADVKYQAVDANKILDEMATANNGLNIVMLDACRDNPYARSFRNAARGLAIVSSAPSGTFISYSTSPGNVARDGDGRNSPYTAALLKYMQAPGLTISDVFINVRMKVKKETGQVPWELSSLEGQFYFMPGSAKMVTGRVDSVASKTSPTDELDDENRKLEAEQHRLEEERAALEKKKALDEKRRLIEEERERLEAKKEAQRQAEEKRKSAAKRQNPTVATVSSLAGGELDDPIIKEKRESLQRMADEIVKQRPELSGKALQRMELQYVAKKAEYDRLVLAMGARPSVSTGNEIGRDGHFIAYDNGTVLDTRTNLMWAAKDNGFDVNWQSAKSYCENYHGGGYSDWRMPTQDELAGLYDSGKSRPAACITSYLIHVATKLIDITCFAPWASESRGSDAAHFNFITGTGSWITTRQSATYVYTRALPVRSVK